MDVTVRTGSTKAPRDTSLEALSFTSSAGESVLLLMEILGKKADAQTVERECEAIVRHALLETEGDAADRLDGTLKELNGLLKGMLLSQTVDDIHMVIGILDNDHTLHVSHAGRAEAYLVRKGIASQVTEYTSGKPVPAFVHIASGKLENRDHVVLSTQRLLRTLTPAQLAKLSHQEDQLLENLVRTLEGESEHAAIALVVCALPEQASIDDRVSAVPSRRSGRTPSSSRPQMGAALSSLTASLPSMGAVTDWSKRAAQGGQAAWLSLMEKMRLRDHLSTFMADLGHPKRKRRAHFLLLAGAVAALLIVWVVVHLFTSTQRSKTRAELESLVEQINQQVQTAENRRIIGDMDAANAILQQAQTRAKEVMDSESGLFRVEALDLLDRIRSKQEEINNIVRLSPRLVANLSTKTPGIVAQGFMGLSDGEFIAYDRQNLYRVLLNTVEAPTRLSEAELLLDGEAFSRFQSMVFLTTGNSVIEMIGGQPVSMKTEDPKGWVSGKVLKTYLRFLYILDPQDKQIYKYERLSNRYGSPVGYNVNGDLTGALDMAIDGSVYVLKEGGTMLKLFRGESQPFVIRRAPEGLLKDAVKMFKAPDGNFYILDPAHARVIVVSDGGANGEATYVKQYVLEGEQVGTLKDLYVDPDEVHLYLLDEKHVFVVDLTK